MKIQNVQQQMYKHENDTNELLSSNILLHEHNKWPNDTKTIKEDWHNHVYHYSWWVFVRYVRKYAGISPGSVYVFIIYFESRNRTKISLDLPKLTIRKTHPFCSHSNNTNLIGFMSPLSFAYANLFSLQFYFSLEWFLNWCTFWLWSFVHGNMVYISIYNFRRQFFFWPYCLKEWGQNVQTTTK